MEILIIDVKQTRAGQTHRCGDRVDEWEITTEGGCEVATKETIEYRFRSRLHSAQRVQDKFILVAAIDVKRVRRRGLPVCFQLAHRTRIQTKAEWQRNHFDAAKYFSGYYELIRSPSGYRFVLVTPHAD